MGDPMNEKHDIKNSPYWKNLYGRDLEDTEIKGIFQDMSDVDIEIYMKGTIFLQEISKESYSIKLLEQLVFPPTRSDWGDFSSLHDFVINKKHPHQLLKHYTYLSRFFLLEFFYFFHTVRFLHLQMKKKSHTSHLILFVCTYAAYGFF